MRGTSATNTAQLVRQFPLTLPRLGPSRITRIKSLHTTRLKMYTGVMMHTPCLDSVDLVVVVEIHRLLVRLGCGLLVAGDWLDVVMGCSDALVLGEEVINLFER